MNAVVDFPLLVFAIALAALWVSAFVGASIRKHRVLEEAEYEDLSTVQGAALTLLGLIIGFSFSMAVGRYDLRKNYEAAEANAIGTEYLRASLLPATEASRIRALLKSYADQRILSTPRAMVAGSKTSTLRPIDSRPTSGLRCKLPPRLSRRQWLPWSFLA